MLKEQNLSLVDRFSRYLTQHRLGTLVVALIVTLIFGVGIFRIQGKVFLEDMLPHEHPFLKIIATFADDFGTGGSWTGILVESKDGDIFNTETLDKVLRIDSEVSGLPETFRTLTFSLGSRSAQVAKVSGTGDIGFDPVLFPDAPTTPEEIAALKGNVYSNSAMRQIISAGGEATIIQTEFKPDVTYDQAFLLLNQLADKYSDEHTQIRAVGFPVLMGWIYSYGPQIINVMAVSTGLIVVLLFLIFRNFVGMAAPVSFGLISTIMGLGYIGWTGINFSPLLYVLAFLVGSRVVSHAVQITHRYMEEYAEHGTRETACYETMRRMIIPNWAGVSTDGMGFLILILVKIALMQQVAILMSFWMFTVALCGPLTPIICSFMPLGKAAAEYTEKSERLSPLGRLCQGAAAFSISGFGKYVVIAICGCGFLFSAWQAGGLKIGDPTPGSSLFFPDHPFNQTVGYVNNAFGTSSDDLILYYSGKEENAVYDPAVLQTLALFDRHMREALPDIYKSSDSFINVMTTINGLFRDGDVIFEELPYRQEEVNTLIGLARGNVQVSVQRLYFDSKMQKTKLTIFFTDHTSDNLKRIHAAAKEFFVNTPQKIDSGEFLLAGGAVGMEIAINEEMKRTHTMVDLMVLGTIFIICGLFYRSVLAGIMLTAPLILGNLVAFCYMSMNGIGLSINTLPVAAVGVGVGVDFAIYIYNRCMEEFDALEIDEESLHLATDPEVWKNVILKAVLTSGKAVFFTGLTMVLPILSWLVLSDLKFQAQMGMFLAMILTTNVVLAMTLHPLMLYVIKPRFISGIKTIKQVSSNLIKANI